MTRNPSLPAAAPGRRHRAVAEVHDRPARPEPRPQIAELYRRAEARLRDRQKQQRSKAGDPKTEDGPQRLLHELEVHQIELELQNAELQKTRDDLEVALEKFTDLYDFAPVGYLSVDKSGVILESNLTSTVLLGMERSRLINRRLLLFVTPASRPVFLAFLGKIFTGPKEQVCEVQLLKEGGGAFWASFRATAAVSLAGGQKWCRVAFGDITSRKQAEETQRRLEALANTNRGLNREIARRRTVEKALLQSEQQKSRLLDQSRHMQEQLRHLSHMLLLAQEDERKRISRELHDVIAQTLAGINVQLAGLKIAGAGNTRGLVQDIARTQRLVEQSVHIVHRFARELRPAVLDDLGLIPALKTFMKRISEETGIRVSLSAVAAVEQMDSDKRTVLYRVAQEAFTNIVRHAHASRVNVKIQQRGDAICMTINDNGKGFHAEQVLPAKKFKRLGLLGMRERLEMIGGHFEVESVPGKGTTVQARISLGKAARGGAKSRVWNQLKPNHD